MNLLVDKLPRTVEIAGTEHPISTGFRTGVLFEQLMQSAGFTEEEKLSQALHLYYSGTIPPLPEAVNALMWFYACGKDCSSGAASVSGAPQRIYSFDQDDAMIYAAFWSQYRIDLTEIDDLHWWKFRALLSALDESNLFVKVMGFRSMRNTSDMTPAQRQYYGKMKALYKLPDERSEDEKTRAFASIFAGGLRVEK